MDFPRYWAKGKAHDPQAPKRLREAYCWGWSNQSLEEAQKRGESLALTILERLRRGNFDQIRRDYGYPDRPMREEVIERIGESMILSRNRYGSVVLNTSRVMFVDVDFPATDNDVFKRLKEIFSREKKGAPEDFYLRQLEQWLEQHRDFAFRVYRTRGGLRYIATHATFAAKTPETDALLESLGSDPLYRRLCNNQDCFRARLTPKPWRMGLSNPPHRFPFETPKAQSKMSEWIKRYEDKSRNFATCRYLTDMGNTRFPIAEIQKVIDLHDRISCSMTPELSLA